MFIDSFSVIFVSVETQSCFSRQTIEMAWKSQVWQNLGMIPWTPWLCHKKHWSKAKLNNLMYLKLIITGINKITVNFPEVIASIVIQCIPFQNQKPKIVVLVHLAIQSIYSVTPLFLSELNLKKLWTFPEGNDWWCKLYNKMWQKMIFSFNIRNNCIMFPEWDRKFLLFSFEIPSFPWKFVLLSSVSSSLI